MNAVAGRVTLGARGARAGPAPEEERKVVIALFTDIAGSTASAEQIRGNRHEE
ncbi:MAG TPA: hypothetical protein VK613_00750 [Gaiellaceae bacterium]|nr:hypothetical protein [Gaiellaceae bacterium]